MKKEQIKIGDLYEHNGTMVIVSDIFNGNIYVSDVEFDEDDIPHAMDGTESRLTDYEVKRLK